MKQHTLVFLSLLSLNYSHLQSKISHFPEEQSKKLTIITTLEEEAKQLEKETKKRTRDAKSSAYFTLASSVVTVARLWQQNGNVEPVSITSAVFAILGVASTGWNSIAALMAAKEESDFKEKHDIIAIHEGEQYLEKNKNETVN